MPPEIMELLQNITENIWQIFYGLCLVGLGCYFKKQFQEIGKIVAKHHYKKKLEEIEHSISKGKSDGEITAKQLKIGIVAEIEKSASKAKADGEITTQHLKRDLLADIKKSESDALNNSEFEYHKRKEDSERLERFNILLFEALDYDIQRSYDANESLRKLITKINKKANQTISNFLYLSQEYDFDGYFKRNPKLFEAKIIYNLYLNGYKNVKFNTSFNKWFHMSLQLQLQNTEMLNIIREKITSVCKIEINNKDRKEYINLEYIHKLKKELEYYDDNIYIKNESLIEKFQVTFETLTSNLEFLSNDIRKIN